MPDNPNPDSTDEKPTEEVEVKPDTDETPNPEGAPEGAEGGEGEEGDKPADADKDEDKDSELPEWAQSELSRARREAANYRTSLREAQAALEGAKTPEEFEAATTKLTDRIAELELEVLTAKVARDHNLPTELASRLKGNTEEELAADAKNLQKFAPTKRQPERLGGGLDPQDDDNFDPVAAARKARASRY